MPVLERRAFDATVPDWGPRRAVGTFDLPAEGFSRLLNEHFRQNNLTVGGLARLMDGTDYEPDPVLMTPFDVRALIGTPLEPYWRQFTDVTIDEAVRLRARIGRDMEGTEIMSRAGAGLNLGLGMVAGTLDPVFLPLAVAGGGVATARAARGASMVSMRMAAANVAAGVGQQAGINFMRESDTAEERADAMAAALALGGGVMVLAGIGKAATSVSPRVFTRARDRMGQADEAAAAADTPEPGPQPRDPAGRFGDRGPTTFGEDGGPAPPPPSGAERVADFQERMADFDRRVDDFWERHDAAGLGSRDGETAKSYRRRIKKEGKADLYAEYKAEWKRLKNEDPRFGMLRGDPLGSRTTDPSWYDPDVDMPEGAARPWWDRETAAPLSTPEHAQAVDALSGLWDAFSRLPVGRAFRIHRNGFTAGNMDGVVRAAFGVPDDVTDAAAFVRETKGVEFVYGSDWIGARKLDRADDVADLAGIVRSIAGRDIRVELVDEVLVPNARKGFAGLMGRDADGKPYVLLTRKVAGGTRTARHEALHALRAAEAIPADVWARLEKAARDHWIDEFDIRGRYDGLPDEKLIEEAIAEAVAYLDDAAPVRGDLSGISTVRQVARRLGVEDMLDKLRLLFDRLTGRGPSLNDDLDAIRAGRYAGGGDGAPPGGGGAPPAGAVPGGSGGGASFRGATVDVQRIDPTGYIGRLVGATSPIMRMMNSPSDMVAFVAERLVPLGVYTRSNVNGFASPPSVMELAQQHKMALIRPLREVHDAYEAYRARMAGVPELGTAGKVRLAVEDVLGRATQPAMSRAEFHTAVYREVGGRPTNIPEAGVAAAAVKRMFDDMAELGQRTGLLKETRANYVPVEWNAAAIGGPGQVTRFVNAVTAWQRDNLPQDRWQSPEHIQGAAMKILRNEYDTDAPAGQHTTFHARGIDVDPTDPVFERFLHTDIETLMRRYMRRVPAEIEMKRMFGDFTMEAQLKEVEKQYGRLIDEARAAGDEGRALALAQRQARDMHDLTQVRDLVRGTWTDGRDPYSMTSRTARMAMEFGHLTMMGGAMLAAIPDVGRIVMVHGLKPLMPTLNALRSDMETFRRAAREASHAGTALDMLLNSRVEALIRGGEDFDLLTGAERSLRNASDLMFKINLLSPWNAFVKQFAGVVTAHRLIGSMRALADGSIDDAERAWLAAHHIDARNAAAILRKVDEHGERVRDLDMPNTHLWGDEDAATRMFRAALYKSVDETIVTPHPGELPHMSRTLLGRFVFMYKSFALAAAQKVMVSGLQQRDQKALIGAMMMVFLGGVVAEMRSGIAGTASAASGRKDKASDYFADDGGFDWSVRFILNGVDRSGITGWLADVERVTETLSSGRLGVRAALGASTTVPRSASYLAGTVAPLGSHAVRAAEIAHDVVTGQADAATARSAWKLVPYNNLPWTIAATSVVGEHFAAAGRQP